MFPSRRSLQEIVAEDVTKVETLLENGNKSRAVSSTLMNSTSSRQQTEKWGRNQWCMS